jgi:hypothetical protein
MGKKQHILLHPNVDWQIKCEINEKATVLTGKSKDSYGNDPFPPRD